MEVSRRRLLQRHLEPARPLRRCVTYDTEAKPHAATCAQALMEDVTSQTSIILEQFFRMISPPKQKEGKISYTRDFLISLANCPEAKKKPEFLPHHPIVLSKAREPEELRWTEGKEKMAAERPYSP